MINRFQSQWRSASRPAWLGLLLMFCAGVADGALVPFFPLWATDEAGISVGVIGLLFGCYAGGELLAAPLLGGIADRIGRRPVLTISSIGVGCGIASLCVVRGAAAAAVVLLLTGICESVLHPTIMTVIADATPSSTHRRWFSLAAVASGAGHILGPLMGAAFALWSVRAVFLLSGGVLLLGGIVVLWALPETIGATLTGPLPRKDVRGADADHEEEKEEEEEESLAALLPAFRDARLGKLLLWVVLFEIAGSWIEALIPLYARDAGTLTPSGVGILFAYGAALTVVLQMVVHRGVALKSAQWLVAAAGGATSMAFAVLAASPTVAALVVAVTLCALAQMLVGPLVPTTVHALAPPAHRASYMAASSVAVDLKDSLGPALGTMVYSLAPTLPWLVGLPLVLIASAGLGTVSGNGLSTARNQTSEKAVRSQEP